MNAQVSIMVVINGRPKSIFSKYIHGSTIEEFHEEAKKVGVEFCERNPHIGVGGVRLTIIEWI